MKKTELSVVNESFHIPGVEFHKNAIIFSGDQKTEDLLYLARQASEVEESVGWFLGDIGLKLKDQSEGCNVREAQAMLADADALEKNGVDDSASRIRDMRANAQKLFEAEGSYLEHAEALNIDRGYWMNCVMLAKFYLPSHRCEGLRVKHHMVAMIGAGGAKGDISKAQAWLTEAKERDLSASELRREVNQSLATVKPLATKPEGNPFQALDDADKWAISHKDYLFHVEQLPAMRTRFQALIQFMQKLK